jgi:uncharacterized protein with von Willebrand factor type A (vWA) domain
VETIDGMQALQHIQLADRSQFKHALAATLIKRAEHRDAFNALFDISFAFRRGPADSAQPDPSLPHIETSLDRLGEPSDVSLAGDANALLEALLDALRRNDQQALRTFAAQAVAEFAGITSERTAANRYYLYRVMRRLDLAAFLRARHGTDAGAPTAFEGRLARDDADQQLEALRRMIAEAIRNRLAEVKGVSEAAQGYGTGLIEDVDFLGASPTQVQEMRRVIQPLAHKLASRMAQRRRFRHRGRLDVRRTMRRSVSAGGVPLEPAFRFPRVSRPDLFLLCDVSGSVSEFAQFTLSLMYAMGEEFSRIRSFAFIDGVDEVTAEFERGSGIVRTAHLLARAKVIWADGHSDYGNVFGRFWDRYGRASLTQKATVIITGDGRNNYRPAQVEALRAIRERARRVYWLNPEPRQEWNTTDSIMRLYEPVCDAVFEVRNLRQLAEFVVQIV